MDYNASRFLPKWMQNHVSHARCKKVNCKNMDCTPENALSDSCYDAINILWKSLLQLMVLTHKNLFTEWNSKFQVQLFFIFLFWLYNSISFPFQFFSCPLLSNNLIYSFFYPFFSFFIALAMSSNTNWDISDVTSRITVLLIKVI